MNVSKFPGASRTIIIAESPRRKTIANAIRSLGLASVLLIYILFLSFQAKRAYEKALRFDPLYLDATLALVGLHMEDKEYDTCIQL